VFLALPNIEATNQIVNMESRNLPKFLLLIPCGNGRSLRGTFITKLLDFLVSDDDYNHFLMVDMFSETVKFFVLYRRGCIPLQRHFYDSERTGFLLPFILLL